MFKDAILNCFHSGTPSLKLLNSLIKALLILITMPTVRPLHVFQIVT